MSQPRLVLFLVFSCILQRCNFALSQIITKGTHFKMISGKNGENLEDKNSNDSPLLNEELLWCSASSSCGYLTKSKTDSKYALEKNIDETNQAKYKVILKKISSGFKDCKEAQREGAVTNQIIDISWRNGSSFRGFCNMEVDQGGWTVFQRRLNADVNFFRNWTEYVNGFGSLHGSFWLGLEAIHQMTEGKVVTLRIDLKDKDGNKGYAIYNNFKVSGAEDKYRLTIGAYTGNVGDSLRTNSNMLFTTADKDNDNEPGNCASRYHGPWWHDKCFLANLNNDHYSQPIKKQTPEAPGATKMSWFHWKSSFGTITYSEMKLRADE